ncbi:hypothetical protein, partial [Salmonella sp. SAL4436]|uniref:hypothetical protein n=1 Tax=Salmonella sp. SAL4436 TaxID=3159891 RepID=UPI00397B641E
DRTVWYRITPLSDLTLGLHTDTEIPEHSLSVFEGDPGALLMLYCSYSSYNSFEALAGKTYFIQLAACCDSPGGPVTITMQD